ncbi:hypothetical protein P5V15_009555 [Pogonomyrmex californicus]
MFNFLMKIQKQAVSKIPKNWRLFHATDFYSLMYPCFTFCRILGIFPYRISDTTLKLSKPLFIVSTIVVYVCCIRVLIMIYEWNISSKLNIIDVPKILERSFYYGLTTFITVVTFILNGPRMRLLQTITKISSRLPKESYHKLSWLIHAKDIFGFFCVIVTSIVLYGKKDYDIFLMLCMIHIDLLVFQMDMMYVNCVYILKTGFKRINDNLLTLQKLMVNDTAKPFGLINHKQKSSILLKKLNILQKQHLMVSDTVQMLNTIFSPQLVATIIINFGEITFCLYWCFAMQQKDMLQVNLGKDFFYENFIFYTLFFLGKTVLIVWTCENGKNEASEISTTVHDVINCTSDKQIKNELQLFSLQISHCNNTFSAKGFSIDAKFLAGVSNLYLGIICFN